MKLESVNNKSLDIKSETFFSITGCRAQYKFILQEATISGVEYLQFLETKAPFE
jgi:hypothetical protein